MQNCALLLLGQDRNRYPIRRIEAEAHRTGVVPLFAYYSMLELSIHDTVEVFIDDAPAPLDVRAAIFDAPGPYIVLRNLLVPHFVSLGIYVLNCRSLLRWPTLNKLAQAYHLHRAGIPVVSTRLFGNSSQLLAATRSASTTLVAKAVDGSGGKDTWQLRFPDQLGQGPLRYHDPHHLLIQPFVRAQKEFRVLVLGGKVIGGVLKIPSPGEFRANREQGASFANTSLPPLVEMASLQSCQVLKCEFAGVDVLYAKEHGQEWCSILEVNRYPNFEGFEQATQLNVGLHVVNWIVSRVTVLHEQTGVSRSSISIRP